MSYVAFARKYRPRTFDDLVGQESPDGPEDRGALEVCENLVLRPAGAEAGLEAAVRHHLHLGVKESLHNIAKHAHATEVWLHMKLAPDTITLTLEDNGRGFEPGSDTNPGADGLANLRQRMKEIGGSFEQQSQSGHGTCTTLVAPLKSDE